MPDELQNQTPILFNVNVIVFSKQDNPFIKLERQTSNSEIMKMIIIAALHERPIVIQPVFNDKLRSISSLIDKGILYRENEVLYFNI